MILTVNKLHLNSLCQNHVYDTSAEESKATLAINGDRLYFVVASGEHVYLYPPP